jgi:hypothetical protein
MMLHASTNCVAPSVVLGPPLSGRPSRAARPSRDTSQFVRDNAEREALLI